MRRKTRIVWHYTYSNRIKQIIESGVLLPPALIPDYAATDACALAGYADAGIEADKKLLLFSENEIWEPASFRGIEIGGIVIDLHRLEDYERYNKGVFRIGVDTRYLKPYTQLCRSVGMPPPMFKGLWRCAVELGSSPYKWWGTTKPIPSDLWESIQVLRDGKWEECMERIPNEPPMQQERVVEKSDCIAYFGERKEEEILTIAGDRK